MCIDYLIATWYSQISVTCLLILFFNKMQIYVTCLLLIMWFVVFYPGHVSFNIGFTCLQRIFCYYVVFLYLRLYLFLFTKHIYTHMLQFFEVRCSFKSFAWAFFLEITFLCFLPFAFMLNTLYDRVLVKDLSSILYHQFSTNLLLFLNISWYYVLYKRNVVIRNTFSPRLPGYF